MPKEESSSAASLILDAAEQLILTQGYNGTSMRDIAKSAGYRSVAGLYNHFPDKEAIFVALLHDRSPYAHLPEIMASIDTEDFPSFLTQLFARMTDIFFEHMSFVQLVLLDMFEFQGMHLQHLIGELQEQVFAIIAQTAQLEGLRQDVSPLVLMRMMGMTIFSYTLTRHFLPPALLNQLSEDEWKTQITEILLHGLTQEKEE